jgi:hypothetical protein
MNQEHNNRNNNVNDRGGDDEYPRPSLEDIAMASIFLPLARDNLLDYLYASGIPLRPIQLGGAGVGGVGGGAIDMDGIASILANSLYDSRPVKNIVDEKGMAEISEKTFTTQLAEELNINTVCGIWQDEFEEGEPIKILPCNHAFKSAAIEKWLTTEKAECPICRFSLSSKEVICHPLSSDAGNDASGGGGAVAVILDEQHIDQDVSRISENNIAARLVGNIQNNSHREDPVRAVYAGAYASRQSISVPINQLLQSRRNMIDNIARASGGARVASRWHVAHNAPPAPAAAEPVIRHDDERPRYINNYYFGDIINHPVINNNNNNEYNPGEDDGRDAQAEEDIINNRYNNNNQYNVYNNINDINNNHVSNREHDDIQEAIRRSLEEQ